MALEVPSDYAYLDWAATAPLCPEARRAMEPFLATGRDNVALGMNANSLHSPGRAAFESMELSRRAIASCIGASRPSEVIFTCGATEADNMALIGLSIAAAEKRRQNGKSFDGLKVVTTAIEHDAVLNPAKLLAKLGFEVVRLSPERSGHIDPGKLAAAVDEATVLVSVQLANSEMGAVQPVRELAEIAHAAGALFHTDAVQALGKTPVNVSELDVDAASFSAHKIGGPKGVGALYLRTRTPFEPLMLGGGQEDGRRSGTQNVCGIAGFAAACQSAHDVQAQESERLMALRDELYRRLCLIDGVSATVNVEPGSHAYLPNIVHVLVRGFESETLVLRLDREGFGVSGGSACSSRSLDPSHVLRAIGISSDDAYGALRISFGRDTTRDELDRMADALESIVLGK